MSNSKRYSICFTLVLATMFTTLTAWANINGAVYTSLGDGTSVDANVYPSKDAVYLNGGPQNFKSAGLPDGIYYYQVTDPSGAVLLSQDNLDCRKLVVANGVVSGPSNLASCDSPWVAHLAGAFNAANGSTPVQLMPFADTPNSGGEYKAWATPVEKLNACSHSVFGFCDSWSKTDNFKVKNNQPPTCTPGVDIACTFWPIAGVKFFDPNATGLLSASVINDVYTPAGGIHGWKFRIVSACDGLSAATALGGGCLVFPETAGTPYNTTTDVNGKFRFDGLQAGNSYGVCEIFPTPISSSFAWQGTPACPNSETGAYSLGSGNLYGVPYPVTYTGNTQHLGLGDAVCNKPTTPNAFFTNISDVFEWGAPGANFGNRCVNTPTGGLTLGFWSNNNGATAITGKGGVGYVDSLQSPDGNGLRFAGPSGLLAQATTTWFTSLQCSTTATKTLHCFSYWLTQGNSANAAYQLSVQMTTARLNELVNSQSLTDTVYAPGTNCADSAGYAQVSCLINEANQAIGENANTPSGSLATCTDSPATGHNCRAWDVAIQTALNLANNNVGVNPSNLADAVLECGLNYTGSESCSVTVPLTPPSPFVLPLAPPIL